MINMLLVRRRILLAKQSGGGEALPTDMVLLINSPNTGDFSVTTYYGTFTAVKVSDYPYFDTTVTHKLSISNVTVSTGQSLANDAVRGLFVGVESWGTSNTYTNTSYLFYGCTSLRSIPDSWEGLANVTSAVNMFWGCTSLKNIPDSWEGLANVTSAVNMFWSCTSLKNIPDSWEGFSALTNVNSMFSGCTSLTNCGTIFTGLAKATTLSWLFSGCTGMLGNIYALYVYLDTKPISVIGYNDCFRNCTQAVGYSSIPTSWK